LTSLSPIKQAQESIPFIDEKPAPLQTAQGCGTQNLKIIRDLGSAHPNNLLALQSMARPV